MLSKFCDAQIKSALGSGPPASIRSCERLPSHRGTAGACNRATYAQKRGHAKVGTKLSVNMVPSGMKEKNVCSGAVGGDYAGADWPIRKAHCEDGERRGSS